jgi:hypothetical protein
LPPGFVNVFMDISVRRHLASTLEPFLYDAR